MEPLTQMIIICGLLIFWSALVGVMLYYKKQAFDCSTNPAIKCWNDWKCWNSNLATVDPDNGPTVSNKSDADADETNPNMYHLAVGMNRFYGQSDTNSIPSNNKLYKQSSANLSRNCYPQIGKMSTTFQTPATKNPPYPDCPAGTTTNGIRTSETNQLTCNVQPC